MRVLEYTLSCIPFVGPIYNFLGCRKLLMEQATLINELNLPKVLLGKKICVNDDNKIYIFNKKWDLKPVKGLIEEQKNRFCAFYRDRRSFKTMVAAGVMVNSLASTILMLVIHEKAGRRLTIQGGVVVLSLMGQLIFQSSSYERAGG